MPANSYGTLVANAFRAAVAHSEGTVVAVDIYDPHNGASAQDLAKKHDAIDALLLPEGGSDLNLIASQLATAGFDAHTVHILGTGLWDVPDLAKTSSFVAGAWYAAPDPAARQKFVESYAGT